MALKKVFYGTSRIQALRRVALDANLLATLGLDVGDLLKVELDIENETVLLTRASSSRDSAVLPPNDADVSC